MLYMKLKQPYTIVFFAEKSEIVLDEGFEQLDNSTLQSQSNEGKVEYQLIYIVIKCHNIKCLLKLYFD